MGNVQSTTRVGEQVAKLLLQLECVSINLDEPFEFASGILSPVYVDNRRLISDPKARATVVDCFIDTIKYGVDDSNIDVIAGTATAGLPWSAWVAKEMEAPLIYVRQAPKERGMKRQVEGILKRGQRALIVEDLITTGLSACNVAQAVRTAGGVVGYCVAIFSFGAPAASERFSSQGITHLALTNLSTVIETARDEGYLGDSEFRSVERWAATTLASFTA